MHWIIYLKKKENSLLILNLMTNKALNLFPLFMMIKIHFTQRKWKLNFDIKYDENSLIYHTSLSHIFWSGNHTWVKNTQMLSWLICVGITEGTFIIIHLEGSNSSKDVFWMSDNSHRWHCQEPWGRFIVLRVCGRHESALGPFRWWATASH